MEGIQTVGDLISALGTSGGQEPIRAVIQPGYPLEAYIAGVVVKDGAFLILVEDSHDYADVSSEDYDAARMGF